MMCREGAGNLRKAVYVCRAVSNMQVNAAQNADGGHSKRLQNANWHLGYGHARCLCSAYILILYTAWWVMHLAIMQIQTSVNSQGIRMLQGLACYWKRQDRAVTHHNANMRPRCNCIGCRQRVILNFDHIACLVARHAPLGAKVGA